MKITTHRDEYQSLLESAADVATILWSDNVDTHDDSSSSTTTSQAPETAAPPKSITPASALLVVSLDLDDPNFLQEDKDYRLAIAL